MDSILPTSSTLLPLTTKSNPSKLVIPFSKNTVKPPSPSFSVSTNSCSNLNINPLITFNNEYPFSKTLKKATGTLVLTLAATLMAAKLNEMPAKAESLTPNVETTVVEDEKDANFSDNPSGVDPKSPLSQLMESNEEFVDNLKVFLQKKLENGEDEEALKVLSKLVEAHPSQVEWKFLMARLLSELGRTQEARNVFEQILTLNPLSFEALFENALLMDRCGEGNAVMVRLEKALRVAEVENKGKEARDVRFIMAQIQFLQKNVDEALESYETLAKEDPKDFRPYFCKGMIYSLLDRNAEAREQFAKYRELSPKKFEVDGYLRSPLSRMKLFGTDS